ncbi:photosynthetic NDH subunit of subcomplex B 3, chloroplastic [Solanum lycopersicum]|uniref:2Fe-2S ferredoxin-type domain-containing protein n=2 Tax=Solanum subgen. Lycopersicon TaxID=49274 RepID=A0A3Q7HXA1_SOLLC|nr:photosynthetic NDH subunit of subcomplex B 3, chloroplastic [Solanum lycopersicum]XP_015055699.1 photosynthetic NDH subunit of subcomplex B 3, chloroplastic-like [Solanum pennellii]
MRAIEIYWYGGLAASTLSQSSLSCISKVHQRCLRTKIKAVASSHEKEEACVKFAFVSSVLLPDGTPDVQLRKACGGQKLRDIMLDANVELYGPYARPLLNCGGGGTCATCLVEVVEGKELLNPRTDKENENLKRHPNNWRLACQAIVGKPDSRGMMTIQQLPEWKAHEWNYRGLPPNEEEEEEAASISSSSA